MPELIAAICRRCGRPFLYVRAGHVEIHCEVCKQRAGVGRPPKKAKPGYCQKARQGALHAPDDC